MAKPMGEVKFVNVRIRFPIRLYVDKVEDLPNDAQCLAWLEDMARKLFRVGISYSPDNSSVAVSVTDKRGKTSEVSNCVTFHGKSVSSCVQKHFLLWEVCAGLEYGLETACSTLEQLEYFIEDRISKLD